MSKKLYIAIDVQNDFISGSLGSDWAKRVTPNIAKFLTIVKDKEDTVGIWATRDTHKKDTYFKTLEGEKLPVEHCIKDTHGWEIDDRVKPFIDEKSIWNKETFMCEILAQHIQYVTSETDMYLFKEVDEIVLMGFCTGICVASNAIYLRGLMPNMKITVLEDLCACVNEDTHKAALTTMGCCQIDIENSEEFLKR